MLNTGLLEDYSKISTKTAQSILLWEKFYTRINKQGRGKGLDVTVFSAEKAKNKKGKRQKEILPFTFENVKYFK